MAAHPPVRVALNVVLDGLLAALAVPLARAIADPSGDWLHPLWLRALCQELAAGEGPIQPLVVANDDYALERLLADPRVLLGGPE